jgi:beta-glucanase (GH16 family)
MEAHRWAAFGARLIDGAILLLAVFLVFWLGVIFVAIRSRDGGRAGNVSSAVRPPGGGGAQAQNAGLTPTGRWRLVWHDEFNQASCPSRRNWRFEHGFVRNGELQWYQPQNAYCRDGVLVLEARRAEKRNPKYRQGSPNWKLNRSAAHYTSASMESKYAFTYGRAEALMRIDPRSGSWPAFWTLGTRYRGNHRAWPGTGEVDIMEYYRDTVLANVCNPKPSWCGWSSTRQSLAALGGRTWADRFHLWAMDWNAKGIELFLDGRLVHRVAMADVAHPRRTNPYVDQPAFLLLSQAIGGVNGGSPAGTEFPVRLEAKYVRVYQSSPDGGSRSAN